MTLLMIDQRTTEEKWLHCYANATYSIPLLCLFYLAFEIHFHCNCDIDQLMILIKLFASYGEHVEGEKSAKDIDDHQIHTVSKYEVFFHSLQFKFTH